MSSELSINSVAANPANVNPQVKTDQATAASQADQNAQKSVEKTKTDTVTVSEAALQMASKTEAPAKLTGTALAKSLKRSGQTPAQIAVAMGLDVKTVNGYLGVATKAPTTTPSSSTSAVPQVKQAATGSPTPNVTKSFKG